MKLTLFVLTFTALIKVGLSCSEIQSPDAKMYIDGSNLTLKWNNDRPDASGKVNGEVIKGSVTFPDDRTYFFNYYKDEETIYWDGDKGETSNIWISAKCVTSSCSQIENPSATIYFEGSDLTLQWKNSRPDASGRVTSKVLTGSVDFPDDREYTFIYYKDEETIYWDGDKGETSNIWKYSKCLMATRKCNQITVSDIATISVDGSDLTLRWNNGRPDARGKVNGGDITGKVNFPDDREYTFNFYKDEETIYWDGDKGETTNIWTSTRCATSSCTEIENLYANIIITGSDVTLKWNNDRPDAIGKINGGDITGKVDFPDDREYTFNYYRGEQTIYWDGDKGETSNIWTSAGCF